MRSKKLDCVKNDTSGGDYKK